MLKHYRELLVWQKSYKLCLKIYGIAPNFPSEEKFGLTSQIKRSAVSIPSNIAEGYGRKTTADYIRMLYISYGSVCELETQILLAGDLDFVGGPEKGYYRNRKNVESTYKIIREQALESLTP